MVRYREDVRVGQQLGPLELVLTTEMVRRFCQVWGSRMPSRFTDDEVARKEGFPGPIVPGIMSMALLGNLLSAWAPGGQVRRLQTLLRRPVPHNLRLRVVGEVTATSLTQGEGIVECDVHLQRDDGESFATGSAVLVLPLRGG